MKYGTWNIILGGVSIITIFSGLPTTTKKIIILVAGLIIITLGIFARLEAKSKKLRAARLQQEFTQSHADEVEAFTESVAHTIESSVESELETIIHSEEKDYEPEDNYRI